MPHCKQNHRIHALEATRLRNEGQMLHALEHVSRAPVPLKKQNSLRPTLSIADNPLGRPSRYLYLMPTRGTTLALDPRGQV